MSPPYLATMIYNTTTALLPTTTNSTSSGDSGSATEGYICAVVAVVLYGSNFVPVKKYKTGDGIFFQWVLCSGIFLSGLVLQMIHNCHVYIMPMLGGVIWACGNLCVVPVIKTIGMGLGLSIWGTCALCIGWAIGRWGLFDTKPADIHHLLMNDFGVILAFISILVLINVKNEVSSTNMEMEIKAEENSPLLGKEASINNRPQSREGSTSPHAENVLVFNSQDSGNKRRDETKSDEEDEHMFVDDLSANKKRLVGSLLSVISGLLYGVNFVPTLYVQNTYEHASQDGLNYVFAQFCGIYLASTVFFVIYCVAKKNKPKIYPQVIVPGLVSGVMWAIATGCWNIANSTLSQAISFPIVATGPCGLASLFWGVFIFGEIRGFKNITILVIGFLINLTGSLLAGLSK